MNTNISIIQLIKSGGISVEFEISQIRAKKDINVYIRSYLKKADYFQQIQKHIHKAKKDLDNAIEIQDRLHFGKVLDNLYKVEEDFVINMLQLAKTLSVIEPRTERLRKTIELFEEGRISEADAILSEADMLNDQFNLIALANYQKTRIKGFEDDLFNLSD